jgi:hypothetical protein
MAREARVCRYCGGAGWIWTMISLSKGIAVLKRCPRCSKKKAKSERSADDERIYGASLYQWSERIRHDH